MNELSQDIDPDFHFEFSPAQSSKMLRAFYRQTPKEYLTDAQRFGQLEDTLSVLVSTVLPAIQEIEKIKEYLVANEHRDKTRTEAFVKALTVVDENFNLVTEQFAATGTLIEALLKERIGDDEPVDEEASPDGFADVIADNEVYGVRLPSKATFTDAAYLRDLAEDLSAIAYEQDLLSETAFDLFMELLAKFRTEDMAQIEQSVVIVNNALLFSRWDESMELALRAWWEHNAPFDFVIWRSEHPDSSDIIFNVLVRLLYASTTL